MRDVYISAVGLARFGNRELTIEELIAEAVEDMQRNADQDILEYVDAVLLGSMSAEEFIGISNISSWVTDYLGLAGKPAIRIETGSSSGAAVFQAGFRAVASGCFESVLVLAGEKMTHLPTPMATRILSEVIDPM
ncbi:thiolase family protein, partial [[Eubacterium] cellulosolvens]